MMLSYWRLILFAHLSLLVIYACYTTNIPLLGIRSYVVSEIADSFTPCLKFKCAPWYGLDEIANTRHAAVQNDWSTWKCAITILFQTLLSALNSGCNILAASMLIIQKGDENFISSPDLRVIVNSIRSEYNNDSYHTVLEGVYYLSIILMALLSYVSDGVRKTYVRYFYYNHADDEIIIGT